MELVNSYIEVEKYDPKKILKNIERACRTCYRSENLITEDNIIQQNANFCYLIKDQTLINTLLNTDKYSLDYYTTKLGLLFICLRNQLINCCV